MTTNQETPGSSPGRRAKNIYALLDAENRPRYVGCTSLTLGERARLHYSNRFRYNTPLARWLDTLTEPPGTWLIQEVSFEQGWNAEKYWIDLLRQVPCVELLNTMAQHGGGLPGRMMSDAFRDKMSKLAKERIADGTLIMPNSQPGWHHSSEAKEKISQGLLGNLNQSRTKIKCPTCGKISTPGPMAIHQKKMGH